MKKFENLGRSLTKNEQKKISGGDYPEDYVNTGYCINGVGCWHYTSPVTWSACYNDIQTYCSSGEGSCTIHSSCP